MQFQPIELPSEEAELSKKPETTTRIAATPAMVLLAITAAETLFRVPSIGGTVDVGGGLSGLDIGTLRLEEGLDSPAMLRTVKLDDRSGSLDLGNRIRLTCWPRKVCLARMRSVRDRGIVVCEDIVHANNACVYLPPGRLSMEVSDIITIEDEGTEKSSSGLRIQRVKGWACPTTASASLGLQDRTNESSESDGDGKARREPSLEPRIVHVSPRQFRRKVGVYEGSERLAPRELCADREVKERVVAMIGARLTGGYIDDGISICFLRLIKKDTGLAGKSNGNWDAKFQIELQCVGVHNIVWRTGPPFVLATSKVWASRKSLLRSVDGPEDGLRRWPFPNGVDWA
ncbi:hypothetical protein FB451DRAFT_1166882 [Mycena latifolia]|nr:hypothetical protein FB451DRAFT_1166882 [Mycena latifolia]